MAPRTLALTPPAATALAERAAEDPWALAPAERVALLAAFAPAQTRWLPRLRGLVEPPSPAADFPAFLLELPTFAHLRGAVAGARSARDLDVATADELQRFVDHFRGWLQG